MKLTLCSDRLAGKPTNDQYRYLSHRLSQAASTVEVTLAELRAAIENGQAFCPATFRGERCVANFEQAQIWCLDFDNTRKRKRVPEKQIIRPDDVLKRCEDHRIMPCIGYYTYSHTDDWPRFRFIWQFDSPFLIPEQVIVPLISMFPEADSQCKDSSRIFLGTNKEVFYYAPERSISIGQPTDAFQEYVRVVDPKHASRRIQACARNANLHFDNGLIFPSAPVSNGESTASSLINTIEPALESPERTARNDAFGWETGDREWTPQRDFNFDALAEHCLLFREFEAGDDLTHDETFGIITNLLRVQGGQTRVVNALEKRTEWDDEAYERKWRYQIQKTRGYRYFPAKCASFCPYAHECQHGLILLQQVAARRMEIRRVEDEPAKQSLEDAERQFAEMYEAAMSSDDRDIHLIIAPTGIGKTEAYLNVRNALVAVPTHRLAQEVAGRMAEVGNRVLLVRELPSYGPEFDARVKRLYDAGAVEAANVIIRHEAEEVRWRHIHEQGLDSQASEMSEHEAALLRYVDTLDMLRTSETAVLTHKRLMHMRNPEHDTLIIDEDILRVVVENGQIKLRQLYGVEPLEPLFELAENAEEGTWIPIPSGLVGLTEDTVRAVTRRGQSENVFRFVRASGFEKVRDSAGEVVLNFGRKHDLPQGKKVIIMSATANERLYQLAFPDRLIHVHRVNPTQHTGQIVHYCNKSLSRTTLRNPTGPTRDYLRGIRDVIGDNPVITYKAGRLRETLQDAGLNLHDELHFGNLEGVDSLKGTSTAVVGCPHIAESVYRVWANLLGVFPDNPDSRLLEMRPIRRNGWEFTFSTYSDENLQEIQLYLIESELIQAVGRARTLRNDCTVHVFTNLILPGVEVRRLVGRDEGCGSSDSECDASSSLESLALSVRSSDALDVDSAA